MALIVDKSFDARMEVVHRMLPVGLASMVALGLCLFAARALLPVFFPKQMSALTESRRFFVAQCVASGLHALVSGPVSTYVMYQLLFSGEYPFAACPAQPNAGTVAAPPLAVWVTGFTCGYFVYDSMVMSFYSKFCTEEMGTSGTLLMWIHHVISIIVWPYCIASDRAVLFVCFFLFTELSNIGQASTPRDPLRLASNRLLTPPVACAAEQPGRLTACRRPWAQHRLRRWCSHHPAAHPSSPSPHPRQAAFLVINKGKLGGSTAEGIVGGGWALTFFLTRIVTIPWLLLRYHETILSAGCMNAPDRLLGLLTVLMPVGLNVYWFLLIARKARRMLAPTKPKAKAK